MPKTIRFHATGGPEVLQVEDQPKPDPGPGEALVRQHACGLNMVDVYQRSGLYRVPLPSGAGNEAAGVVEAVGTGVTLVNPGDRVAYAGGPPGAYAEVRAISADRLCVLPEPITFEQGAAMMLKGLTVQYLVRRTFVVKPGDVVLFHAAAGGVGLIACQWLKALGARVIGTAGSDEKCAVAVRHGAEVCVNYRTQRFVDRVKETTGGAGVAVVYDSVGRDTFMDSLDCLRPLGLMVSFGNASGPVPAIEPSLLAQKGSLFLTRPTLGTYTARREDLEAMSRELFDVVMSGKVRIPIERRYPLEQAALAHRDLEARRTVGASVLLP